DYYCHVWDISSALF
nr:immunoglobulin light chain junction region [Macaca mulatta]